MNELRLATREQLKSKHDDFLDTISQLPLLSVWKPEETELDLSEKKKHQQSSIYEDIDIPSDETSWSTSYIV